MRLLVSVATAAEAAAAVAGGADVIDAKNPFSGALGAVDLRTMREIRRTVAGTRLVTAAIGEAADEAAIERRACSFVGAGAALVKVGFAGITRATRVEALIRAAVRGARTGDKLGVGSGPTRLKPDLASIADLTAAVAESSGVVAVAYVDAPGLGRNVFVDIAARAGAAGVLLDTTDKTGPGLRALLSATALCTFVSEARGAGLLIALAGKLTADDLVFVRDTGADIAGVRGAACEGGRRGRVTAERVAMLRTLSGPAEARSVVSGFSRTVIH